MTSFFRLGGQSAVVHSEVPARGCVPGAAADGAGVVASNQSSHHSQTLPPTLRPHSRPLSSTGATVACRSVALDENFVVEQVVMNPPPSSPL